MNNTTNNVMKYVGAAFAVGGTMLLGSGLMKDNKSMKKKIKKTADKALNAVDGILSGVQSIVK